MENLSELIAELISGDDERAESSVGRIAQIGSAALPELKALLSDADPEQRWWAIRAMAALDHPEIPEILLLALSDPDLSIRQCAARGLCDRPNSTAIPELVGNLDADDRLLARLSAYALEVLGSEAVPALLQQMKYGSPQARLEAVKALAAIGDPRAIGPFFKAIREGDTALIEYWADIGLERMGVGMVFFNS